MKCHVSMWEGRKEVLLIFLPPSLRKPNQILSNFLDSFSSASPFSPVRHTWQISDLFSSQIELAILP